MRRKVRTSEKKVPVKYWGLQSYGKCNRKQTANLLKIRQDEKAGFKTQTYASNSIELQTPLEARKELNCFSHQTLSISLEDLSDKIPR